MLFIYWGKKKEQQDSDRPVKPQNHKSQSELALEFCSESQCIYTEAGMLQFVDIYKRLIRIKAILSMGLLLLTKTLKKRKKTHT